MKPILRWAGSKRKILDRLSEYWDNGFERYVEPFAGSCSLFFHLQPKQALLGDKNPHLIEAYEVLRRDPDGLYAAVVGIPTDKETYYRVRALDPSALRPEERAAHFVYLNRNCFNGIYRTNRLGRFNVPYAPRKTGALPSLAEFRRCAVELAKARIRAWDFGTTLRYAREGDFVYLDPPFAVGKRRVFKEYGPRTFDATDLSRLREHLRRLDYRGVRFLLSYADCREIRAIGRDWNSRTIMVRRNIAGFAGHRRMARELLITNG